MLAERFNYFHEMVVQEERSKTMCPGYEDGLDGAVSIGLPVLLKYGSEWMKQEASSAVWQVQGFRAPCFLFGPSKVSISMGTTSQL